MCDLHSVIICVINSLSTTKVLMVKHKERGWEFPGGKIQLGEEKHVAAMRELQEETQLSLKMEKFSDTLIPGCRVYLAYHNKTIENIEWNSKDKVIELVKWMEDIPVMLAWPKEEFEEILEHFGVHLE